MATSRPTNVSFDPESQAWLESLRGAGAGREEAVARLHALMLRAARFEAAADAHPHPSFHAASSRTSRCTARTTRSWPYSQSSTLSAGAAALRPGHTSSRCSRPR